jgi:hypothetical protein
MNNPRDFNMADAIRTLTGDYGLEPVRNIIGARLVSASKSGDSIEIVTDRGTLMGNPEGDCCSSSWVESVECDAPAGAVFLDKVSFDDREPGEWSDGSERKVYFGTFYTDKGRVAWEMRNESNGYYGGWINWSWSPVVADEAPEAS